jgi:hypothetical protein
MATPSSSTAGTGKLAMSTFAKQFLKNPIQLKPREPEDDDDDSPVSPASSGWELVVADWPPL